MPLPFSHIVYMDTDCKGESANQMKSKGTAIALLVIGVPLMIYGAITYATIVNGVSTGNCSLNPVSNLPKCEDATEYGAAFVVGIVVSAGGIVVMAMSRKHPQTIARA